MSNKKEIILACEIYPPDIGGPATYAFELREQLLLHGYIVKLLTFSDRLNGDAIQEERNVRVNRKGNFLLKSLRYGWKLFALAGRKCVIYAMGPVASGLPAFVVGWLKGCRVVVRVPGDRAWETHCQGAQNMEPFEEFQRKTHRGWVRILEIIERFVVRGADYIVVPSIFLKNIVNGWGADENRITVIPNAINIPISNPPHQEHALSILAIGRLVPWKGFSDLIQAFQAVVKSKSNATLTIVGDGPERAHLEALARKLMVSGQTHFAGFVLREDLLRHWRDATVFVLPSGYEGFPHLVLEAWAAGVPVIVSDVPGNTGVVRNGENGLVVPYQDSAALSNGILALALDADLRQRLRAHGAQSLARYRWDRIIGVTVALLKEPH